MLSSIWNRAQLIDRTDRTDRINGHQSKVTEYEQQKNIAMIQMYRNILRLF